MLSQIEIDDCSQALVENLKAVYKLLSHLALDAKFLAEHGEFFPEGKGLGKKHLQGKAKEP